MATTLNIKINPQIDKAELQAQLGKLGDMKFDAEVDTEQIDEALSVVMKNYQKLEDAMSAAIDLDVNAGNADQVIEELYDAIGKIEDEKVDINLDALANEFKKAKAETEKLLDTQKSALAQMKMTGQSGSDSYKELEAQIKETETILDDMKKAAGEAGNELESASKKATFADKMAKFGLVADGINSVTESVKDLSQPFVDLDTATNKINTLGGEAKKIAPSLREMSLEMSKKYPIGAAALQTATYDALSAGIKATKEDIGSFMDAATKLAVGGGEEVGNTVNLLSSLVNAYGESASKTGEYSDLLFTTVNLGKTNVQELSGSLSNVIPTAAAYGFSLKNVGASLALMTANGIPTAQATTKLNQLMLEMQKPGSDLEKILNKAGVSVESLGAKVKSGDVIGALKDMDSAFKKSGTTATQAFSSAESGAAFNVLTKDFGKLQETMNAFNNSAGSTDAAYQDMSQSIENRSKALKAQVESAFIGIADASGVFGTVAVTGAQMFGQLSPMITALSGFKMLFGDMASSAFNFAKSILAKVVPSLFTQVAATEGATVAQYSFNSAALLNPYIIGAAVLAGAVIGIIALANALSDSTENQLDANKANQEAIKSQMDANQSKQDAIKSNQDMIKSYEELGNKTNRTAQEEEQFKNIQLKLAEAYPGTIKASDDFNTSLGKLKGKAGENKEELGKLATELESFQNKANSLQLQEKTLNIRVAEEDIGKNTDNQLQNRLVEQYANAMNGAKNSSEVKKSAYDLKMALVNSEGWADMDAAQKKAVMAGVDKMAAAASEKADLAAKQSTDIMNNAINNIATNEGYHTTVEAVASKSKKSVQEVQDAMISNLAVQSAKGKDTETMYAKVAETLHKSPEEIKQMVAAQKDSVAVAKAQSEAIADIAKKWNDAKSAAETNISTQKSVYLEADKELRILKQKKNLTDAEKQKAEELLQTKNKAMGTLKEEVRTKKQMEKDEEKADYASGLKVAKGKTALELAQAEFKTKSASLENDNKIYANTIKNQAAQEKRKLTAEEEKKIEANNLLTLQNQRDAYEEIYKRRGLINGVAIDGTVEFDVKLKDKQDTKNTIQSEILDLSDKLITAKATVEPKVDLSKLGTELSDAQFALDKKKLEVKIEQKVSSVDLGDITKLYSTQFDSIALKRTELTEKLKTASEAEKLAIQKDLIDLQQKEIALNEEKLAMNKKYSDKKIVLIEEEAEKSSAVLVKQQTNARQAFETVYDTINTVSTAKLEASKVSRLDSLDKQMNAEIARVGSNEQAKAAITQKYNNLKSQAEADYASKQAVLAANLAGEKRAFEDEIAKQTLEAKQTQLQKELELAKQSGDTEKAKDLQKQIDATAKEIEGKGDVLKQAMNDLGIGANEALASALSGDTGGIKKALKKQMADIGGYIKRLATAKVIEIVLKSTFYTDLAAMAGPFAPAVEAGAIGLMTAGMNALLNPVVNTLTSFPTGAGYINEPTMFIAGDGGRLGGENKEVLLRDDQFQATLSDVLERQRNETANMIASAMGANQQTLIAKISGTELLILLDRAKSQESSRVRTINKS